MNIVRCPIVELRQYALHPGQRVVLIALFDREFVESQEELELAVLGQFRDLDNRDRFVWLRGFETMPGRAKALASFYSGPAWRAHSAGANATMIDSDNVLLLRPVSARSAFPAPGTPRPPAGHTESPTSLVLATIYYRDRPFDDGFLNFFDRQARPALAEAGAQPLAWLQTEYAENTFPALPDARASTRSRGSRGSPARRRRLHLRTGCRARTSGRRRSCPGCRRWPPDHWTGCGWP